MGFVSIYCGDCWGIGGNEFPSLTVVRHESTLKVMGILTQKRVKILRSDAWLVSCRNK